MLHKLYLGLYIANPIFDILLLFVLFARRRAASFPFFTLCTVTDAVQYTILLCAGHHAHSLFYKLLYPVSFAQEAITLLVAYELCIVVFRPTGVWASDVRKPLLGIAGAGVIFAVLISFLAHPPVGPHTTMMWRINLFDSILMNVLFGGMLILSSLVGLPWKTHAARIAQIMCASSIYGLIIQIINMSVTRAHLNRIYIPTMCIEMILGCVGMVYWLLTLWPDEPITQPLPAHMRAQIYALQQQTENDLIAVRSWNST